MLGPKRTYYVSQCRLVGDFEFCDFPGRMAGKRKGAGQGGNNPKKPVTSEVVPSTTSSNQLHRSNPSHSSVSHPPPTSISPIHQVYCSCRSESRNPMVACDACEEWYHFHCVGLTESAPPIGKWHCPTCIVKKMKVFAQSQLVHWDILLVGRWVI
jgi:hypothetical protein